MFAPWKEGYDKSRQCIKKQRHHFAKKMSLESKLCFFSSHVWMWELDHKESWVPKNWCFWTVMLEKTLESPLDCKEIKPVNPKGNQPWIFIGRTDAEVEVPIQATWYEELTHWKKLWCWERFRARGEGGNRGWDGWMPSPTQWTWVWANSGREWRTGNLLCCSPGRSQKAGHSWVSEHQRMMSLALRVLCALILTNSKSLQDVSTSVISVL